MNRRGNAEPQIGPAPTQTPDMTPDADTDWTENYRLMAARGAKGAKFSDLQRWKSPDDWARDEAARLKNKWEVDNPAVSYEEVADRIAREEEATSPNRRQSRYSWKQKLGASVLTLAMTAGTALGLHRAFDNEEAPHSQPVATATATPEAPLRPGLEAPSVVPETLDVDSLVKNTYGNKEAITEGSPIATFDFVDGKIVTGDVAPNLTASDPALATIIAAVLDNQEGLVAANRSKTLEGVRFEFNPDLKHDNAYYQRADTSPAFGSDLDVIHYQLPTNGKFNRDNIATTIGHENIHALVEQLGLVDRKETAILSAEIVPVDMERYSAICSAMRDDAVSGALSDASKSIDALAELTDRMPTEYQPQFREVLSSMRDGTFGNYQAKQGEGQGMWESVLQSCSVDDPWKVISRELRAQNKTLPLGVFDDPTTHSLYQQVRAEWSYAIRDQPLYAAIRENSYIPEGSGEAGHPHDSANELITSTLNIAFRFPDQLRDHLQNLPANQQELVKELLNLASSDLIRLHQTAAPEFTNKLAASVQRVIA